MKIECTIYNVPSLRLSNQSSSFLYFIMLIISILKLFHENSYVTRKTSFAVYSNNETYAQYHFSAKEYFIFLLDKENSCCMN